MFAPICSLSTNANSPATLSTLPPEALRAFFNFCVREELLTFLAMAKVTMPKVDRPILPSFEPGCRYRTNCLKSCKGGAIGPSYLVLLDTGCRAAELLHMNGGDIDVPQGIVHIRKGKGGKDRIAYLGNRSRKMMLRYYLERGQPGETEPVWVHAKRGGHALPTPGCASCLNVWGKASGVNHCHPHTFRRTFALWSLRNGMSIYHLQRLMGHSDLTVLRQYLALVESDLKAAHVRYGAVDNMIG
jgi:integrase/recombinase XerD